MEHLVEGHLGGYWIDDRHPELISNKEVDDIINFENIIKENNKTKKLLLKSENKKQD